MTSIGIGLSGNDDEVRPRTVGDERLGTVDHPVVPVADRLRLEPGDIRAGIWLGNGEGADGPALDRGGKPLLVLLGGAEVPQVKAGEILVRAERGGHATRTAAG